MRTEALVRQQFPIRPIDFSNPAEEAAHDRMVALVERNLDLHKEPAAASARADRLTQAVLAKAFRGELVPTEGELARREGRSFESAGELLERMREVISHV